MSTASPSTGSQGVTIDAAEQIKDQVSFLHPGTFERRDLHIVTWQSSPTIPSTTAPSGFSTTTHFNAAIFYINNTPGTSVKMQKLYQGFVEWGVGSPERHFDLAIQSLLNGLRYRVSQYAGLFDYDRVTVAGWGTPSHIPIYGNRAVYDLHVYEGRLATSAEVAALEDQRRPRNE